MLPGRDGNPGELIVVFNAAPYKKDCAPPPTNTCGVDLEGETQVYLQRLEWPSLTPKERTLLPGVGLVEGAGVLPGGEVLLVGRSVEQRGQSGYDCHAWTGKLPGAVIDRGVVVKDRVDWCGGDIRPSEDKRVRIVYNSFNSDPRQKVLAMSEVEFTSPESPVVRASEIVASGKDLGGPVGEGDVIHTGRTWVALFRAEFPAPGETRSYPTWLYRATRRPNKAWTAGEPMSAENAARATALRLIDGSIFVAQHGDNSVFSVLSFDGSSILYQGKLRHWDVRKGGAPGGYSILQSDSETVYVLSNYPATLPSFEKCGQSGQSACEDITTKHGRQALELTEFKRYPVSSREGRERPTNCDPDTKVCRW